MIGTILKTLTAIVVIGGIFWTIQIMVWNKMGIIHETEAQKTIRAEDIERIIERDNISWSIIFYSVDYYENETLTHLELFKGWIQGEDIKKSYEVRIPSQGKPYVEIYRAKRKPFLWHNEDFATAKREHAILYIYDTPPIQSCTPRMYRKSPTVVFKLRYSLDTQELLTC